MKGLVSLQVAATTSLPHRPFFCAKRLKPDRATSSRNATLTKESNWRPHRQVREVKGRGNLRRLNKRSRKGSACILVIRLVGTTVKTADANGPCCDGIKARSGSESSGQYIVSWNVWCTHRVALCCHPNLGSLSSGESSPLSSCLWQGVPILRRRTDAVP